MCSQTTPPAEAYAPDADRAGPDAFAHPPEWLVHILAMLILFLLQHTQAMRLRRFRRTHAWWRDRPDLPAGSAQGHAASVRGPFGRSIAWMCRRRGIGPGHPDWPELARAIVAFGGSVKGARPGLPALGPLWWENSNVTPGIVDDVPAAPAAEAMALLLSRLAEAAATAPAPRHIVRSEAAPGLLPAFRRRVFARTATGPPTGPPASWADQFSCAHTNGASAWLAPPY